MNSINERLLEVIYLKVDEKDRYKKLEEMTAINKTSWSNAIRGKQRVTLEMVELCCRAWRDWMPYIVTGEGQKPILDMGEDVYQVLSASGAGIHLKRDANGKAMTNVPHQLNIHARLNPEHSETELVDFEWGYHGKGSLELAGNVLYLYNPDKTWATKNAELFQEDVLCDLPHKESFLSKARVLEWIELTKTGNRHKAKSNLKFKNLINNLSLMPNVKVTISNAN